MCIRDSCMILLSWITHHDSAAGPGDSTVSVAPTAVMLASSVTSCRFSKNDSRLDSAPAAPP
eukprot:4603231-Prymnesium_polylepis.1